MKKFIAFLIICFLGCGITPLVGPIVNGVIAWKDGEAHKYYPYDTKTVYHVSKRALRDMDLSISEDIFEPNGNYYIVAGENDRFKINITRKEENISKLSVRVNFMGDKPYAELFYKKVDEMLNGVEFGPDGRPVRKVYMEP